MELWTYRVISVHLTLKTELMKAKNCNPCDFTGLLTLFLECNTVVHTFREVDCEQYFISRLFRIFKQHIDY